MSVISLLTDFGSDDNFVGIIKGVILNINPKASIVDISHKVKPQDIFSAAFLLDGAYKYFPRGTIHMVVVDPGVGSERNIILVKTKDYFFIAPDNGVLGLALKNAPVEHIINVTNSKYFLKGKSSTFHGRDIIAPVAGFLSKGVSSGTFGKEIRYLREVSLPKIDKHEHGLSAPIIYFDRFGNIITSVTKKDLKEFGTNIKIRIKDKVIEGLKENYAGANKNEPLVLINSFGYLEIALNCGNAREFFSVSSGDRIEVLK